MCIWLVIGLLFIISIPFRTIGSVGVFLRLFFPIFYISSKITLNRDEHLVIACAHFRFCIFFPFNFTLGTGEKKGTKFGKEKIVNK